MNMKLTSLLILLFLSNSIFSQKFTLNVSENNLMTKSGFHNYGIVISEPDKDYSNLPTSTIHELNLNNNTSSFFFNGVFISIVKIIKFEETETTYNFTMLDYDTYGNDVITNMLINKDLSVAYFYWYNKISNTTKVEIKTKFYLTIEN